MQKGMDSLMHGRTVFVIAHRLSTVQNSDVIMVLDHGHIIEKGNHEKLIAEKGGIASDMMYNTFNMGLGMVIAVEPKDVDAAMEAIRAALEDCGL